MVSDKHTQKMQSRNHCRNFLNTILSLRTKSTGNGLLHMLEQYYLDVHADCFSFLFGWKKYIFYVHVSKFPYLTENKETGPSYICLVILSNNFFINNFICGKFRFSQQFCDNKL